MSFTKLISVNYCVKCDKETDDWRTHKCFVTLSGENPVDCWDEDSWNAAIEAAAIKAQDNGAMLLAQEIRKLKK